MKAILMSIRPKWVAKILNGEKTIEIRKKFPKDYVGWVYIYCTKENSNFLHNNCIDIWWVEDRDFQKKNKRLGLEQQSILNGKVVAIFWCDKVEEIVYDYGGVYEMFQTNKLDCDNLNAKSCLTDNELKQYLKPKREHGNICGKAIHITNLEIFDKPKELSKFKHTIKKHYYNADFDYGGVEEITLPLTRAPQSWCYVEVE